MNTQNFSRRKIFSWAFHALIILFFVLFLWNVQWSELKKFEIEPLYLIFALPISLALRFFLPLVWILLIRQLGEEAIPNRELIYVYSKAWMGRYIPGKVAWLAGKVYFASKLGLNKTVLGTTSLIEAGIQLVTALVMAFLLLGFSGLSDQINERILILAGFSLVAVAAIIFPPVFNSFIRTLYRLVRKVELDQRFYFRFSSLTKVGGAYLCIHAIGTIPYFLIVKSIYPNIDIQLLPFLGAVHLMAGVLGTLAVFTPSGIGVREGVQAILLSSVLPKEVIILVLILARVWSAAMDVSFFLIAKFYKESRQI